MYHFDKQNLSFQSITQTMKIKKSKKQGLCFYHHDKQAKYRDRQSEILYCKTCAIQQASKGALIEDFTKTMPQASQNFNIINEVYEQFQCQIQEYIQNYNAKYQKLLESLTEMQIKDLLIFNKQFQQNNLTYQKLKGNIYKKWNIQQIQKQFQLNSNQNEQIISKINSLNQQINDYKNYHSKDLTKPKISLKNNTRIRSQALEIMDHKLLKHSNISLQQINSRQSATNSVNISQNNTNSLKSKDNSTLEQIKKSVYEDTPESVKFCMSDNCIKVTNNMAITMFEKIDVCESISLSNNSQTDLKTRLPKLAQNNSGRSSQKSRYRYGTVNQP